MDTAESIKAARIIAISRGIYGYDCIMASKALYEGGVRAFEITFEQDKPHIKTIEAIESLIKELPSDAVVGAGTVMNVEQVHAAYDAGALFIISPNTDPSVIGETKRLGMVSIPGAMTPTEIAEAYSFGADIVKVFPAGILGVEYFKAVKAPLAHIPMAAVAAITVDNIKEFSRAGAEAFGISSSLYKKNSIFEGRFDEVRAAAEAFFEALK